MEVNLERKYSRLFKILSWSVHALGAVHFIYGCYYDWFNVHIPAEISPIHAAYAYKFKFLTYWDAITQASYFTFCIVVDVLGSRNAKGERNLLVKIKDFVEASIAFPIAMFVGLTFWGLMAVDRELVLPAALDPYFPPWLNHMMHTNIIIFQILEIVTSKRVYPPRKYCIIGLMSFQTLYLAWMHIVYYKSGVWAYPIFEKLNIYARVAFLAGCFALGGLLYYAGEKLHQLLWPEEKEQSHED